CIEATSDELLGAYSKAEDNALSVAFGGRNKKRLNRVFDAIGFVNPDYRYPLRGQGKKRKIAASVITAELKGKKMKVFTHRPRYIEPAVIPKFSKGTSSAAEAKETDPIVQSAEEQTVVPKVPTFGPAKAEDDKAEEPQEKGKSMGFPKLEDGLSILLKDDLANNLAYNSIKGLILSNALRAQKNIEDEGYTMALNNLRSEVIDLRNEGIEKDKILISLANREISDYWKNFLEKNVEELRQSKERCFKKSLDCVKKLKTSLAKVGAYSAEENFVRGNPEGVVEWLNGEAETFEEILSDRGDVCAFSSARGISSILEKARCDHIKTIAQAKAAFSVDDTKDPSAEATLMGGKFYNDVWVNGGRELAHEIIKKVKKTPTTLEQKQSRLKKLQNAE
ncbi:hypothetical protein ACJX0J_042218, partial [Zea mays]